jgi:hypothetical protein
LEHDAAIRTQPWMGTPSSKISPSLGAMRPAISDSRVVFSKLEYPAMGTDSPQPTVRSTPGSTRRERLDSQNTYVQPGARRMWG